MNMRPRGGLAKKGKTLSVAPALPQEMKLAILLKGAGQEDSWSTELLSKVGARPLQLLSTAVAQAEKRQAMPIDGSF